MPGSEDDELMNHVALEFAHAVEAKDKEGMMTALQVMMAHTLKEICEPSEDEES